MKYPTAQFEELIKGLEKLSKYVDVSEFSPNMLHYTIAQQYMIEGQPHNQIYFRNGELRKAHSIEDLTGWEKLIDSKFDFKLYPEGCNDSHIETAMKKALKQVPNRI